MLQDTQNLTKLEDVFQVRTGNYNKRLLETAILPEEKVDALTILSQYQTFFSTKVDLLENKIDDLENKIFFQSQIIQDLQQKRIISIQNLHSPKLLLSQPLYINIENENNIYVASSENLNLYGDGITELESIRNLCTEIEDLYFDLKKSKNRLGKLMKENWFFLKSIIKEAK